MIYFIKGCRIVHLCIGPEKKLETNCFLFHHFLSLKFRWLSAIIGLEILLTFRIPFLGCFQRLFFALSIATQDNQKQG